LLPRSPERATAPAAAVAPTLALKLTSDPAALEPARLAVLDFVAGYGLSERSIFRLELVLEETLMNLVAHAFPAGGAHEIDLMLRLGPGTVTLCFEDDGLPFDPTGASPPARPRSLAEAAPGGLGLSLTRQATSGWHYERARGRNRLTLEIARD